ncbi:MAG: Fic family protein [Candidatus Margulisbacteria bacterium]|jgi:Fic family protein|nr:Fic family protein [Candidatus Margulisiibacteriota bacterium]
MLNVKNIKITPQLLLQIAELDEFKGAWAGFAQLRPEQLKILRKVSTIESVGSSNRIEGNKLSDTEVERLLSRINKKSFKSRDEEEVAGYAELMNRIFDDYEVIPLSENYLKQLHQILLQYVGRAAKHRGEYKKIANSVAAFDYNGREIGIVFETALPFDTPRLMAELMEWTRKNLDDSLLHPLLVLGVFIVHFLVIHPFQDGNGRLSRALTALLLLKKGYAYVPYGSLESIIEANKEGYYRALRRTQKNIWSGKADYEPWLAFFLTALQKQKRHLAEKIALLKSDDTKLSRTARSILALFENKLQWTILEAEKELKENRETIRKSVKSLVAGGYLVKHGTTRGAWYEKAR